MKNHERVNGKLYQINKRFSDLKESQKSKINDWLYEEFKRWKFGEIKRDEVLINVVYKIEGTGIWIPRSEVIKYYHSHINKFNSRLCKERSDAV